MVNKGAKISNTAPQTVPNISNRVWFLSIIAILIVALPFIGVHSPALTDYPNHLARFHILQSYHASESLQDIYTIKDGFFPYWAIAVFMKITAPLVGVEAAGKLFILLSMVMPVIGVLALNKTITARTGLLVLFVASILTYNDIARWGFSNYLFTIGLSLLTFAAWIRFKSYSRWIILPLFAALGIGIASMHMIALGALGLMIGLWELYPVIIARKITARDIKTYLQIAAVFIPAFVFFLTQSSEENGVQMTRWNTLDDLVNTVSSPFFFTRSMRYLELGLGVLVIALIWLGLKRKVIRLHPRLGFVALGMLASTLILPFQLMGVAFFGYRLAIVAAFTFAASLCISDGAKPRKYTRALAGLLVVKLAIVGVWLHKADAQIESLRAAAQAIEPGSKIMTAIPLAKDADRIKSKTAIMDSYAYTHLNGYVAVDRDVLFPSFFSMYEVGFQPKYNAITPVYSHAVPLKYLSANDTDQCAYHNKINDFIAEQGTRDNPYAFARNWKQNFDYVIVADLGQPIDAVDGTTIITRGTWFSLLKINKPSAAPECKI